MQNDGSYYDATKTHEWNVNLPSLAYRQYTSMVSGNILEGGDVISQILAEGEDYNVAGTAYLLRVTTAYWKSQRKVGHLTKVADNGEVFTEVITEDYKVIDKPI